MDESLINMLKEKSGSSEYLKAHIRNIPDFPKPGILFKDITPLLTDVKARQLVLEEITGSFKNKNIQAVAAIEARGFLFGMLIAESLEVPFIPVRKPGKLPYKKIMQTYELEYGVGAIEIHEDALSPGTRVLIHDDLLATGGTAKAAGDLINRLGGTIVGFSFVINLSFLPGFKNLSGNFGVEAHSVLTY